MKKYNVRIYYSTFADFVVEAENRKEAIETAKSEGDFVPELLQNLTCTDDADVDLIEDDCSDCSESGIIGYCPQCGNPFRNGDGQCTYDFNSGNLICVCDECGWEDVSQNLSESEPEETRDDSEAEDSVVSYETCCECEKEIAVKDDMVDMATGIFTCPLCGTKQHLCSMCRVPDENSRKCHLCTFEHSMFEPYD